MNSRDAAREDGSGLTNVARLERAVAPRDAEGNLQHTFYHPGVGVGPWYEKMLGGAFGVGLSRNVQACYAWLVEMYEPGDQLVLFGFSRGAYTARSLGGLVRNCGLLKREHRARVGDAYRLYRDRRPDTHPSADRAVAFRAAHSHEPRIHCIGVWDTVGSLGVPTSGPVGWLTRRRFGFHDVTLSARVDHAFHALAIDERRRPFAPTLWEIPDADLGPDRARSAGLAVRPEVMDALEARCDGMLYDSMSRFYRAMGEHRRMLGVERRAADGRPVHTFEDVHDSVFERRRATKPPYEPDNLRPWLERLGERRASPAAPDLPTFHLRVADSSVPDARAPDAAPRSGTAPGATGTRAADQASSPSG